MELCWNWRRAGGGERPENLIFARLDVGLSFQSINGSFTLDSRKFDWEAGERYQLILVRKP